MTTLSSRNVQIIYTFLLLDAQYLLSKNIKDQSTIGA